MVASFQKVNPLVRKAGSFLVLTFICCCHTKVTEGRVGTDVVVEPWITIVLTPPPTIPLEITSHFSFQTFVLESEMT